MKTAIFFLLLSLLMGAKGCDGTVPDQGTVTSIYSKPSSSGARWYMNIKLDVGRDTVDGPYNNRSSLNHCAVGSRWPSCVQK